MKSQRYKQHVISARVHGGTHTPHLHGINQAAAAWGGQVRFEVIRQHDHMVQAQHLDGLRTGVDGLWGGGLLKPYMTCSSND